MLILKCLPYNYNAERVTSVPNGTPGSSAGEFGLARFIDESVAAGVAH